MHSKVYVKVIFLISLVSLFLIDRFTKYFIHLSYTTPELNTLLPKNIELYHNPGIILGFPLPLWFIFTMSGLLFLFVIDSMVRAYQHKAWLESIAWSLVAIGGMSNFIDRARYGFVIDWLILPWNAVVNLADAYISVGICLLAVLFYKQSRKK